MLILDIRCQDRLSDFSIIIQQNAIDLCEQVLDNRTIMLRPLLICFEGLGQHCWHGNLNRDIPSLPSSKGRWQRDRLDRLDIATANRYQIKLGIVNGPRANTSAELTDDFGDLVNELSPRRARPFVANTV